MVSSQVKAIILESCQAIEAAAAAMKAKRPESIEDGPLQAPAEAKARLSQAVEAVRTDVAKCAIMGEGIRGDPSMAAPLLGALQQKTIAICAMLMDLQTRGGTLLSLHLHTLAKRLTDAVCTFMSTLGHDTSSEGWNRQAGVVFQRCQAVKNAPLNEKAAFGRGILQVAAQLKDVIREVQELKQEACARSKDPTALPVGPAETDGVEGVGSALQERLRITHGAPLIGEVDGESEDGVDLDYEAQSASPQETAVIAAGLDYLVKLSNLLESLLRLLQTTEVRGSKAEEMGWENVLSHLQKLANPTLNDLGAGLYPPQDRVEIKTVVGSASSSVCKLAEGWGGLQTSPSFLEEVNIAGTALQAAIDGLGAS